MKFPMYFAMAACVLLCACGPTPPADSSSADADRADEAVVINPSATPGSPPASAPLSGRMTAPPVVAAAAMESTQSDSTISESIDALLGDHVPYQAAIETLQAAVRAADAAAVAAMTDYPITVEIDGRKIAITDQKSFVAKYAAFMTPAMANAITTAKYGDLMVNANGVMFGNGEAWINGICKEDSCATFDVKLVALNSPQP